MIYEGYNIYYPDEWCWFKNKNDEWIEVRLDMRLEYGEFYDCEVQPVNNKYDIETFVDSFKLSQRLSKIQPRIEDD